MRVSAKAEYACIAMMELASRHAERVPVRVKAIADAHGIPQGFLVQILLQLKGAGLVESIRGAAGGYLLARPPMEISVADIVNTIDHPEPHREPVASPQSAAVQTVRAFWREVQAEEQRLLESLDLAELLRRTQETHSLSYQI
jgi:Rrf2 family protein